MNQSMKILTFDLEGSFAHFRKFYTNSSSLTYAFPPPTTIAGILASILGYERDSYYEIFSTENFRSTVEIINPVRKILQTVNYMFVVSNNDVNRSKGSTQVPLELLVSQRRPEKGYSKLKYRIYCAHKDEKIMMDLKDKIEKYEYVYPASLGLSECTGILKYVDEVSINDIHVIPKGNEIKVNTLCPVDSIEKGSLILDYFEGRRYVKELIPIEFFNDRQLKASKNFLYEDTGQGIIGKFNIPILKVKVKGEEKHICWFQEVENDKDLFPH